jgi:Domain of unknown function (DUF5665)
MKKQHIASDTTSRKKANGEKSARQAVLEDLFYDFNRSRVEIYRMNFIRGIFFGLGSVLGGTLLVALLVWLLSLFGVLFPPIAHFVDGIITAMQHRSS